LRDEGDTLCEKANDYRETGEYERAIAAYGDAQAAYGEALETATDSDHIDATPLEEAVADIEDDRRDVRRQQLRDEVDKLRSTFERADALAEQKAFEKAKATLEELAFDIESAKETALQHGFDGLHENLTTLERRRENRLGDVSERLKSNPVPDAIPRVSNISVEYDALTDREPIGGGGNADVSKAILPTPDGDVTLAIKEPRMAGTLQTDVVERMLEEAETWDKLDDHDHIVGVVDYGSTPIPWIAMEYMDAGHLGERSGELNVPQALWTAIAITKGVRHAHRRGIAHLDLKPQNVLFRSIEDAWDVPKIADWGLSKHLLDHSKSVEGLSPRYAAPEQFDEEFGSPDDVTDIYQLGAVFYELFTGRPPFEGKPFRVIDKVKEVPPTPPSEIADVPDELDEVLLTALAKQKADRYESVLLLRNELQELFDAR
jgi:serine/threonine protein kinase